MNPITRLTVPVFLAAFAVSSASAQQKQRFASLAEAMQSNGILAGRSGPVNVNWFENGNRFSYIVNDPATRSQSIHAMDPATGKDTTLFGAERLTFPGTNTPFTYEAFQWAHDSKHLLFQTNTRQLYRRSGISDYYIYTLADRSISLAAKDARTAELSPSGAFIGMERGGNMYVKDLSSGAERQLTNDATEHVYNGHFDWVYEEEFGQAQAWNWSPDSRHIAYWQVDERAEPTIQLTDYSGLHPDWDQIRIPQPGDSNPAVRIGVVGVAGGKTVWLDPHVSGEFYIPRIYWTSRPDTLAVMVLNRPQNDLRVLFFDVNTGGSRQVFQQTSNTWIDVYDFYAGVNDLMTFPENSHEFFWLSDRDGYQQIYRYDYSGALVKQVTTGAASVTRIEGVDPASQTIYFTSTDPTPLQRQLWSIRFDGSNRRRITTAPGTHSIDMGPNTRFYFDRWSSTTKPLQVELWTTSGGPKILRAMETNQQTTDWLATHAYATPELFTVTSSDGVKIDAGIIKPIPFDSTKKYPVVFAVYGGPGSQDVYDRFMQHWGDLPSWGYAQWLAQNGYIVVGVNNRATNNYGRDFMKVVYEHLGQWESHDFAEVARYLDKLPYVDASRVGIAGTSYGGYSTVYTMEMYPDLFSMGIANSAVADWRLYDTIYTERYMNVLGANQKGYEQSSCVVNASKLKGHLLLIHAMMDDNVHPQNTMQMLTAFTEAHKDVSLRIYPPGHHGSAYDGASYVLIQQVMDDYFNRFLKR